MVESLLAGEPALAKTLAGALYQLAHRVPLGRVRDRRGSTSLGQSSFRLWAAPTIVCRNRRVRGRCTRSRPDRTRMHARPQFVPLRGVELWAKDPRGPPTVLVKASDAMIALVYLMIRPSLPRP
jgi:hypothetical protein